VQVLSNGGMATHLAFLYILDSGCGERPINFLKDYRASWLGLGILGKFQGIGNFRTYWTHELITCFDCLWYIQFLYSSNM
jgi:hypothetical protein